MNLKKLLPVALALYCVSNNAYSDAIKAEGMKYGVTIESSRIIYPLNSRGVSVSVFNPQAYPILVNSRVLDEERKKTEQFFVTPPLFRLDAEQKYTLRVTHTGEGFPDDRESLFWYCSKGIPPKADDLWVDDNGTVKNEAQNIGITINVSIDNCIKLIVRPEKLERDSLTASKISWKIVDGKLIGYNPTSFYINLGKVMFNGEELRTDYIPPKGEKAFPLSRGTPKTGNVIWREIDDYGSLGAPLTKDI